MKRYELKDKERQAAFEKVFPGFGRLLNEACMQAPDGEVAVLSGHGAAGQDLPPYYQMSFPRSTIEFVTVYDPKGWNNYPEVKPPEGVLMQVEGRFSRDGRVFCNAMHFHKGHWCAQYEYIGACLFRVERFRPWDEEEKANERH